MATAADLTTALTVLAVDPAGLRGLWLRGPAGALRPRLAEMLAHLPPDWPVLRLPAQVADEALFGGIDLTASLAAGRAVQRPGLLERPGLLVLPMAERCPPHLAGRLAQALDGGRHALIALDEAMAEGEGLPPALADRLGLFVALDGVRPSALAATPLPDAQAILAARALLPQLTVPPDLLPALVEGALRLGVASLRAAQAALAAARVLAALDGCTEVTEAHLARAAALTLAHRGAPPEAMPQEDSAEPPPAPQDSDAAEAERGQGDTMADRVVEAAQAMLPPEVMAALAASRARRAAGAGGAAAAQRAGNRRGRPLPARRGKPGSDGRLDLMATLRAAAPQQARRRASAPIGAPALIVQARDLHVRRFRQTSDRVLIFVVDASGSAAAARLAEAKGAVEILLAEAYRRRDHVALVSFRGTAASLILPPTRSLTQTKARLRGLPGGGPTPLAAGLRLALETVGRARAAGLAPALALLTDGRGNIALDGQPDRAQAAADTTRIAGALRADGVSAVVIDTGMRPHASLAALAVTMQASYVALPRADARGIARAVGSGIERQADVAR